MSKKLLGVVQYKLGEDGKPVYPKEKDWIIFKLVDNTKSGGVYIPNIDDVINPNTITKDNKKGTVERARLLSGVPSIWIKEQKDLTPEYIKQNGRSIEFPRGVKLRRIASHDKTMLEMMRVSNSNIGNPLRVKSSRFEFYEYSSMAAEQESFGREELELEVANLAAAEKFEDMKKHAAFLGIRLTDDDGEPKGEKGIRREYVIYAKRNPEYFKKTLKTAEIEIAWQVRRAVSESIIEVNREPGKIFWANGGGMICAIPHNENPQKYLTDLAMTNNEEGRKFKEELQKAIT